MTLQPKEQNTYLALEHADAEIPERKLEATARAIETDLDGDRGVGCRRR